MERGNGGDTPVRPWRGGLERGNEGDTSGGVSETLEGGLEKENLGDTPVRPWRGGLEKGNWERKPWGGVGETPGGSVGRWAESPGQRPREERGGDKDRALVGSYGRNLGGMGRENPGKKWGERAERPPGDPRYFKWDQGSRTSIHPHSHTRVPCSQILTPCLFPSVL